MELNKILHPDLLPEQELHQILDSLSIKVPANLPKLELLEIFKKVALPLPQRSKEIKPQPKINDISADIDLGELSLSNEKNNDERVPNRYKKIKVYPQNEERRDINDLILQLEKDCDKMVVDVENFQVSKANHRKVALKRSHLFKKDDEEAVKKMKYYDKLAT